MKNLTNKIVNLDVDKKPKVIELKENFSSKIINIEVDKKPKIN